MKRLILIAILTLLSAGGAVSQGRREFLSPDEVNGVQDEQDAGKRVLLYLQFAQRRLDAVRAKQASGEVNAGRDIQGYLSEYSAILDALTDSLNHARAQRSAMGKPIKELESQATGFLRFLQALESSAAANRSDYQFALEEAIDTTKDELAEAKKGEFPEVNAREPPTDLPASPPRRPKTDKSSDAGKSGADKSSSEEGPPRKKSRSSSHSQ